MNSSTYRHWRRSPQKSGIVFGKAENDQRNGGFSDSDSALILMLVLLLQSDGADELLIMALLYILT